MWQKIAENKRNTWILLSLFGIFILLLSVAIGYVYGSWLFGIIIGAVFIGIYTLVNYFFGAGIILAISGAREVKKEEYPYLFNTLEGLAIAAGIPKPRAYVIDDTALNAFATGRDPQHSVIVVTTGLLQKMNRQELEGVIAHEMSHIQNYDIRLMLMVSVFVAATALLSDFLLRSMLWSKNRNETNRLQLALLVLGIVLAILSPFIAALIQLAISRQREYLADANGALLTRNPDGLASALEKIGSDREILEAANSATAHLYIDNPLKNRGHVFGFLDSMFLTHPPIGERVARLRNITK